MTRRFDRGDVIVFRYHHPVLGVERGAVARVVEDTDDRTIIYISSGSEYRQVIWMGDAPPKPEQVGKFEGKAWWKYDVLRIMYPGVPYSMWAMWYADSGEFAKWYVNIESPLERTEFGFTAVDHELDIVANPDLSWEWKDEAELARMVDVGIFTAEQAEDFRKHGEDAVKRIEERTAPFNEPWPEWRPDPSWGPLKMPEDDSEWME